MSEGSTTPGSAVLDEARVVDTAPIRAARRRLFVADAPLVEVDGAGATINVAGDWWDVVGATKPGAAVETLLSLVAEPESVIDAVIAASNHDLVAVLPLPPGRLPSYRWLKVVPVPAAGVLDPSVRAPSNVLVGLADDESVEITPIADYRPVSLPGLLDATDTSVGATVGSNGSESEEHVDELLPETHADPVGSVEPSRWRWLQLGGSALCFVVMLWRLPQLNPFGDSHTVPILLWLLAFVLLVLGVRTTSEGSTPLIRSPKAAAMLALITIVGILLRVVDIETIPLVVFGDEGEQGMEARRVLDGSITSPFWTGWLGVPTMSFYWHALGLRVFGDNLYGLRMAWAVVGIATVPLTYLLSRRLSGSAKFGLVCAALVATYHFHVHYSRLGSVQISDTLFMGMALWLYHRAVERNQPQDWVWVGGITGLSMYFYAGGRLTIFVVVAIFVYQLLCRRGDFLRTRGKGFGLFLLSFVVVAGPMLQFAVRNWTEFNARLTEVRVDGSPWWDEQIAAGRSSLDIWWQQFERSLLAFNRGQDTTIWYGLEKALLDRFFGAVFLFGLAWTTIRVFRFKDEKWAPIVAWWWAGMLAGGFLTLHPPSTQRIVTLAIPTVILIAVGLAVIVRGIRRLFEGRVALVTNHLTVPRVLAVAVLAFGLISYKTYFVDHPRDRYGAGHSALMTFLAEPVNNDLDDDQIVHFAGEPFVYWGYGTQQFLTGLDRGVDLTREQINPTHLASLGQGRTEIVFAVAVERIADLDTIRSVWPVGELRDLETLDGRLLGQMWLARTGEVPETPTAEQGDRLPDQTPRAAAVTDTQVWRQLGVDGFLEGRGLAVGREVAFVVDTAGLLVQLDRDGAPTAVFDLAQGESEFVDLVVTADDRVLVADARNKRLLTLGDDGFPVPVPVEGVALDWVRGIGLGLDGTAWAASPVAARVTQFDAVTGETRRTIETPGRQPVDVVQTADGSVWVVDAEQLALVRFDAAGELVADVALPGFTSLEAPHLALAGEVLWITDPEASSIRPLDSISGEPLAEPIRLLDGTGGGLDKAIGIAVGPDGRVWVPDAKRGAVTITVVE